jgi:tetratricopeptide (TPR) repeat protein
MPWNNDPATVLGPTPVLPMPVPAPETAFDRRMRWLLPIVICGVVASLVGTGLYLTPLIKAEICINAEGTPDKTLCEEASENTWLPKNLRQQSGEKLVLILADASSYEEVIRLADRLEKTGALSAQTLTKRGHAYYYTNKYNEAAASYANALALNPADADTLADLVWTQIQNKKFDQARKTAAHFLLLNPESAAGYVQAARAEYYDDQDDAAIEFAKLAIKKDDQNSEAHNVLGLAYEDQEHYDLAIASYDTANSLKPDDSVLLVNRARARRANGDATGAITDYKSAIPFDASAEVYVGLANAQVDVDLYDDAKQTIGKALEKDPKSSTAYLALARYHYYKDENEPARTAAKKALELDPESTRAKYRLALIDKNDGKYQVALAGFQVLQSDWPTDSTLQVDIGHTQIELDCTEDAIKAFDKAIAFDPKNSDAYDGKARAMLITKDWQTAKDLSDEAIALYEKSGTYFARRAYAQWALHSYDAAQRDYDQAIKLSPNSAWISDERLLFISWDGKLEDADKEITALIAKPSANGTAYRAAGHIADRKKDSAAAVSFYEMALKSLPNDAWLLEDIGWASLDNNQPVQARDHCAKMITILPNAPEAYRCHARALYWLDDTEKAVADLTTALQKDSKFHAARYDRGYMYLASGKNEEAIDDFKRLIAAEQRLADSYYYLGLAQERLGNERAAIKSYETSLLTATDQTAKDANRALQMLQGKLPKSARDDLKLFPQLHPHGPTEHNVQLPELRETSTR